MGPEVFYVPFPAPHDSWEWGWDALVALGTLALALVTVAAVVVPLIADRNRAKREQEKLAVQARLYATALQDESARIVMTTAEIRKRLRFATNPGVIDWDAILLLVDILATPVLDSSFDHVFLLDVHASRFVVRTRSQILSLKAYVAPFRRDPYQLVYAAEDSFLPLILQLQLFATAAARNIHRVAEAAYSLPKAAEMTAQETKIVAWIESGPDPAAKRPDWPYEPNDQ